VRSQKSTFIYLFPFFSSYFVLSATSMKVKQEARVKQVISKRLTRVQARSLDAMPSTVVKEEEVNSAKVALSNDLPQLSPSHYQARKCRF
jgi:hypothetical protein